jgi:hypothetical protein
VRFKIWIRGVTAPQAETGSVLSGRIEPNPLAEAS